MWDPTKPILKLKHLVEKLIPGFFKKYPIVSFIIAVLAVIMIISVQLSFLSLILKLSITTLGLFLIAILGVYFLGVILGIRKKEATIFLYGMGDTTSFPISSLDKMNAFFIKRKNKLLFGHDNNQLDRSKNKLKKDVKEFKSFIASNSIDKFYICGLARIPFLVVYGTLLHSIKAKIIYLERDHNRNRWEILPDEIAADVYQTEVKLITVGPNNNGDVALTIEFSSKINTDCIPERMRNNIASITIDNETRNFVKSKKQLEYVMNRIRNILDNLSNNKNIKQIHLFASVQTVVAIELGKIYQNGMHKPIKVYYYNAQQNTYTYSLSIPYQN